MRGESREPPSSRDVYRSAKGDKKAKKEENKTVDFYAATCKVKSRDPLSLLI